CAAPLLSRPAGHRLSEAAMPYHTLDESQDFLADVIRKTLVYLGFEPQDVEIVIEYPDYGGGLATVHWSAQTTLGDTTGRVPVPYFDAVSRRCHEIRRAVAEAALARSRALDLERRR